MQPKAWPRVLPSNAMSTYRRRETLDYVLSTATTAPTSAGGATGSQLRVLGLEMEERAIYVSATSSNLQREPQLHRLALDGVHAGQLVPMDSWYQPQQRARLAARLLELESRLVPIASVSTALFSLSTRVIQHRAELVGAALPVRKYTLAVVVDGGVATRGRAQITAWLRPRVALAAAWHVPRCAIAVVLLSYIGVADGIGRLSYELVLVPKRRASATRPMSVVLPAA